MTVETPAGTTQVTGRGGRLEIDVPNLSAGMDLLRTATFGRSRSSRRRAFARLDRGLRIADLDVELRLRGAWIGRLGPRSRPTWIARAVGLPFELPLRRLLPAVVPVFRGRSGRARTTDS